MSKSITIPTNCNPYIVVINNHVYTYRAGDSVEVPDEVAEVIEDALELEPKPKRYLNKLAQLAEGGLAEITAGDLDGIANIASFAFYKLMSLTNVAISNSVTTIGECAFFGCNNLVSLRFGDDSKIKSIKSNAFEWCDKMTGVCLPETPPTLENINAFANINADCVFLCKTQESLNAYKVAPNWSTLAGTYSFVVEA